jgi:arylsulfatase A-like enzyme
MRVVMVMFDSLNRHFLPPYGGEAWVHAPNFRRLAQRALTFDRSYVCSMPCMPARRDLHTGRPGFLHRGWGPLEPFDDSMPQMLRDAGVYTHLVTDHYHYFEDGGCNYHTRYNSWRFFRGQEGDPWVGQVAPPDVPPHINGRRSREDWINRREQSREADMPQTRTFAAGLDFIERNHDEDNWFLQIECFDPHEPFVAPRTFRDLYPREYTGPLFDWPGYQPVRETPEQVEDLRRNYAALLSKCDASLGDVLDAFDRHDLWRDTMLVVWTDHGFLLGEHGCWAKNWMPLYEEVSHTPLLIYDPRHARTMGERRGALVQPAIDLAPTLLRFFGLEPTPDMRGCDLEPVIETDASVRDVAVFGLHGGLLHVTDGRWFYCRGPATADDGPVHQYTLVTTTMRPPRGGALIDAEWVEPLTFSKGMGVLKVGRDGSGGTRPADQIKRLLFDLRSDPRQLRPMDDPAQERRLVSAAAAVLAAADAPADVYRRFGLPLNQALTTATEQL